MSFWGELRSRGMFRAAGAYAVVGWAVAQGAGLAEGALGLPSWFDGGVLVLLLLGFPVLLVAAWMFEVTPDGVRRTAPADIETAPGRLALPDILLTGIAVVLIGLSIVQVVRPRADMAQQQPASAESEAAAGETTIAGDAVAAPAADALSIAVLPFVNLSSDPEQEYFSDGLSEELLNVLAQIEELSVAGRTSSFAFKNQNQDMRVIGEALDVANILEGSVRKSGDQLRITAQLVSVADGYHLWSETYDRELTDIFAVQEEIAMAVADALSITLGFGAAPEATTDVDTYDLYLRGRAAFNRGRPEDLLRAAELYREVIARDPDYAPAYVSLATTNAYLTVFTPERLPQIARELDALIADGQARAPGSWSTEYVSGIAHWRRREFAEVFRAMERAEALAPGGNTEVAALRATFEFYVGRSTKAVGLRQALVRRDPLSAAYSAELQQVLDAAGQREAAEAEYQRSLDFQTGFENIAHQALFRVWNDGDDALTAERFDRFLQAQTVPMPLLADVRAVFDDAEAARALLRAGFDDPVNQDPTRQFLLALYAAHYGDPDLAVAALRRAHIELGGTTFPMLWSPDMAAVRRTEGFKDLVREIGMVDFWRESGEWADHCRPLGDDDFECF